MTRVHTSDYYCKCKKSSNQFNFIFQQQNLGEKLKSEGEKGFKKTFYLYINKKMKKLQMIFFIADKIWINFP